VEKDETEDDSFEVDFGAETGVTGKRDNGCLHQKLKEL